jgi:hypothetical protein
MKTTCRELYDSCRQLIIEKETRFNSYGADCEAQLVANALFLQPNGEWSTETTVVFSNERGATQIEFQEDFCLIVASLQQVHIGLFL